MTEHATSEQSAGRSRLNVGRHRRGRWLLGSVVVVVGVFSLVARYWFEDAESRVAGLIAVGLVALLVAVLLSIYSGRRDRLMTRVVRARPAATVIPGYCSSDLRDDAIRAGVPTRGLAAFFTTTLALAVLDDRVEVWIRGDRQPRWSVRRAGADVSLHRVWMGRSHALGIRVSDGDAAVTFVPHHEGVLGFARLDRALRELGEDPGDHLER